jgi:hypothetical protein
MKAQSQLHTKKTSSQIKILAWIMAFLSVPYFFPAFMRMYEGRELDGSTLAQVRQSALKVRRAMPSDERTLFDTAFGVLEKIKNEEGPDAFVNAVDGLKPEDVIALARQTVNQKIAAGSEDFKPYHSWDEMINKALEDSSKKNNSQAAPLRNSERTGRSF